LVEGIGEVLLPPLQLLSVCRQFAVLHEPSPTAPITPVGITAAPGPYTLGVCCRSCPCPRCCVSRSVHPDRASSLVGAFYLLS
jgi:hypothetical protein